MVNTSILWIDLRLCRDRPVAICGLEPRYRVTGLDRPLPAAIAAANPEVLCFEYDFPDSAGLHALRETKKRFQRLPILMLTEMHSEGLPIWAFRSGVRDYLVKPIEPHELQARLDTLIAFVDGKRGGAARPMMAADCTVPAEFRHRGGHKKVTQRAINYRDPLSRARLPRNRGPHLRDQRLAFLAAVQARAGRDLQPVFEPLSDRGPWKRLQRPGASVTEVAFAVGFSSPSHFSHCFRRYGGISPSEYHRHMGLAPGDAVGGVALTRKQMASDRA